MVSSANLGNARASIDYYQSIEWHSTMQFRQSPRRDERVATTAHGRSSARASSGYLAAIVFESRGPTQGISFLLYEHAEEGLVRIRCWRGVPRGRTVLRVSALHPAPDTFEGTSRVFLFPRAAVAAGLLTAEHVPPESFGRKELLLTCARCNHTAGAHLDSQAGSARIRSTRSMGGSMNRSRSG